VTQITGYRLVNSLKDLENVAADLAGNYALGRDIDASSTSGGSYVPLGGGDTAFTGQFDGQGHTISALTVVGTAQQPAGMFSSLGKTAVVRDLNVNGSVTIDDQYDSSNGIAGMLAGVNDGTIVRVSTSGNIGEENYDIDGTSAGGLAGVNQGTIQRSDEQPGKLRGLELRPRRRLGHARRRDAPCARVASWLPWLAIMIASPSSSFRRRADFGARFPGRWPASLAPPTSRVDDQAWALGNAVGSTTASGKMHFMLHMDS
jgi:hypothetical protein